MVTQGQEVSHNIAAVLHKFAVILSCLDGVKIFPVPRVQSVNDCGIFCLKYVQYFIENHHNFVSLNEMLTETANISVNVYQFRAALKQQLLTEHGDVEANPGPYCQPKMRKSSVESTPPSKTVRRSSSSVVPTKVVSSVKNMRPITSAVISSNQQDSLQQEPSTLSQIGKDSSLTPIQRRTKYNKIRKSLSYSKSLRNSQRFLIPVEHSSKRSRRRFVQSRGSTELPQKPRDFQNLVAPKSSVSSVNEFKKIDVIRGKKKKVKKKPFIDDPVLNQKVSTSDRPLICSIDIETKEIGVEITKKKDINKTLDNLRAQQKQS
ncbi:hypothetical protein P9112_007601 [Eukaryota sp. TZLM1-RC]